MKLTSEIKHVPVMQAIISPTVILEWWLCIEDDCRYISIQQGDTRYFEMFSQTHVDCLSRVCKVGIERK